MKLIRAVLIALAATLIFWGCAGMPRARLGKIEASAPRDTGKPAVISNDTVVTEVPLPANTVIESDRSVSPGEEPARLRVTLPSASTLRVTEQRQSATSGTVDTTVAARRADNAARQPLLYASIGAAAGVVVFMFLRYPTPALLCGAASVVFFVAWQAAGLPSWFWMIGAVALAGGTALYFGFERGAKQPPDST